MKEFNDSYYLCILDLRRNMKKSKIKIKDISEELGVCHTTLYRYFNFKRAMPLDIYLIIKDKVKEKK